VVRQIRTQRGLSHAQLARASGIDQALIKQLEAGELDPEFDLLRTLAKSLGVSASALFIQAERP
jgi:transcriptional regulator with XRE-family HTH domain